MKTFMSVAALSVLALLMVGVFAVGEYSGDGSAAECNEKMDTKGRLAPGESVMLEATFCSDPSDSLVGWVNWGKRYSADKDLAVVVTSPSGMEIVFNDGPSSTQTFIVFGPLEEGDWTVEVVNVGTSRVRYELQMAFG